MRASLTCSRYVCIYIFLQGTQFIQKTFHLGSLKLFQIKQKCAFAVNGQIVFTLVIKYKAYQGHWYFKRLKTIWTALIVKNSAYYTHTQTHTQYIHIIFWVVHVKTYLLADIQSDPLFLWVKLKLVLVYSHCACMTYFSTYRVKLLLK